MSVDRDGEVRLQRAPSPADGTVVLDLGGELDLAVAADLRTLLEGAAAEGPKLVVVDLTDVSFIDSTILREVLRAHHAIDGQGGRLVVAGPQPSVERLLQLTGTTEVFSIAPSRDAALQPG
jgi:anti-sigma B factor antagonist